MVRTHSVLLESNRRARAVSPGRAHLMHANQLAAVSRRRVAPKLLFRHRHAEALLGRDEVIVVVRCNARVELHPIHTS
jgi:hypothetical protein